MVSHQELAGWAAAIFTGLAVGWAIFHEGVRAFITAPRLKIIFKIDKSQIRKTTTGGDKARNFLFKVKNIGLRSARNVRVFIENVKIIPLYPPDPNRDIWYHPTQLHWSGTLDYPAVDIPARTAFFLDFIIALVEEIDDMDNVWENYRARYFAFWVDAQKGRGLINDFYSRATYIVNLYLTADNAKAKKYTVEFCFDLEGIIRDIKIFKRWKYHIYKAYMRQPKKSNS